jgi:type I restriction enzyme S subunit
LTEQFAKLAHDNLKLIWENERESRALVQLRDTLLPKLISGELRVPDAERIVGAAV